MRDDLLTLAQAVMKTRNARSGDALLHLGLDVLLAEADRVDPMRDDDDEASECLAWSAL